MKTIIPLGPKYSDARGEIQMIVDKVNFNSASLIVSLPNTTRASHWHKKDSHYCMVCSGEIWYYERAADSQNKPKKVIVKEGELFYTPPLVEHEMFFPKETVFLCLSTLPRDTVSYEADTVRLTKSLKDIHEAI